MDFGKYNCNAHLQDIVLKDKAYDTHSYNLHSSFLHWESPNNNQYSIPNNVYLSLKKKRYQR